MSEDRQTFSASGVDASTDGQLTHWRQMQDYYKTIYDDQVRANNNAAADATAQMLSVIDSQISALNEGYKSADRQLYRDYMESKKNLPQQLSAAGYSGGLSESGRIALDTGYQDMLNDSQRARLTAVSALRAQGEEQRSANEAKAAAANADALKEYYGYLTSLEESEYAALRQRAGELAKGGDFSLYEAIGYSADEVERLRTAWEAENPELAITIRAKNGEYTAEDVAAMPVITAQMVLVALGYLQKTTGKWDAATERAYKAAFGRSSGNYRRRYTYRDASGGSGGSSGNAGGNGGTRSGSGGILVQL